MIDPLAVFIQYLKTKTVELGTDQIADKHRFLNPSAEGWAAESLGIVATWDDGPPDHYVAVQNMRAEVRIYGPTRQDTVAPMLALLQLIRDFERTVVSLPVAGVDGLMYNFLKDSGVSYQWDDQINKDFALLFCMSMVGENAV